MTSASLSPSSQLDTLLWQAANPGENPATREAAYQRALSELDNVVVPPLPTDEAGYRRLTRGRTALSSLYCFAFNRDHPAWRRVSELEGVFAQLQARYNRRFLVTDPGARMVARAHLWRYYLTDPDPRAIWVLARDLGVLAARRDTRTGLLAPRIIGVQRTTGDNTFTVDARGRQRRRYLTTIGRQAFYSERTLPVPVEQAQAFLATVPELDDLWSDVGVGDHKYGATGSRMTWTDRRLLHDALVGVPDASLEAALPRGSALTALAQLAPSPVNPEPYCLPVSRLLASCQSAGEVA